MLFDTLIIAFNNPRVLRSTLESFFSLPIVIDNSTITVLDNGSPPPSSIEIFKICRYYGINYFRSDENRGWGASINHYLKCQTITNESEDKYLLIMAHDALFVQLSIDSIAVLFRTDKKTLFVSPSYLSPRINTYNIFKSYHSFPGSQYGRVMISQQTAFFANPKLLLNLKYDEEFWIYGCEYEIQLRANDLGLSIYQLSDSSIINPDSDIPSSTANTIYTLNSIYLAHKRHGVLGMSIRSLVVAFTMFRSLFSNTQKALDLFFVLSFAYTNLGKAFRSYKNDPLSFLKFPIRSLAVFRQSAD